MSFFNLIQVAHDLEEGENTDVTLVHTQTGEQASFTVEKTETSVNVSPRPYDKNAQELIDNWTKE